MACRPCLIAFNNEAYMVTPMAVHASHAIHRGPHSTGLICCGFVLNLFVKHVNNKSNEWSLSLTVHVCAKSRQLFVCVARCCQYWQILSPGEYTDWFYLPGLTFLVPAHAGSPRQIQMSCKTIVCVSVVNTLWVQLCHCVQRDMADCAW